MASLRDFTAAKPRPLPVIILADVSGSMGADGKIDALNTAIADMIAAFSDETTARAEIHVSVITFGAQVQRHVPLQPAHEVQWAPMQASGRTPLGQALTLTAELLEDRDAIPGRAYRPTLVLVSDGIPTDDWRAGLDRLLQGRGKKVDRMALAIGGDADEAMLRAFLENPEMLFRAEDAGRIGDFFRFVTMSVATRSKSADPNAIPSLGDPFADEDY